MLRRLVLIALVASPSVGLADPPPLSATTEALQAESASVKAQRQAQQPAPAAPGVAPGPEAAKKTAQKEEYQFAAAPYLGITVGPRNTYTGKPSVFKGFDTTASFGAATMLSDKWYAAGEVFVGYSALIKNYNNPLSVRSDWTYGLDIIPGYMVTHHVLGYLRFGVANTNFTRANAGSTAWRLGIGGETNLCKRWDVRGEYVYNGFKRIKIGKPGSDQFNLGILYKFT